MNPERKAEGDLKSFLTSWKPTVHGHLARSAHAVHICNRWLGSDGLSIKGHDFAASVPITQLLLTVVFSLVIALVGAWVGVYTLDSSTDADRCAAQIFSSTPHSNQSFSQLVQTHLCHAMYTSFKLIAMLVLITSAFPPVFSAPLTCVLIFLLLQYG